MLTRYPGVAAARVAALVFLVLVLRLLVVPFALTAVLLDRAQGSITEAVAAIPTESIPSSGPNSGGEQA